LAKGTPLCHLFIEASTTV
ncbi:hypothetical protein BAE44_0010689, partial [Dichanthelium oligosanthes]